VVRRSQYELIEAKPRRSRVIALTILMKLLHHSQECRRKFARARMEKFAEIQSTAILEMQPPGALERQKIEDGTNRFKSASKNSSVAQ
jgi:hypothetical protein